MPPNKIDMSTNTTIYGMSMHMLMQEALNRGYELEYIHGAPSTSRDTSLRGGIARGQKDGKEIFFKSTCVPTNSPYGVYAADDKVLTSSLLSLYGLSSPETVVITSSNIDDYGEALDLLDKYHKLVVKPVNLGHGEGITTGVKTKDQLYRAIDYALGVGSTLPDVIVQQQVDGKEYRFFVIEGKTVAVSSRRPAFVTGNGKSTIKELILEKNKDPRRGPGHEKELTLIDINNVARSNSQNFLDTIPVDGQEIDLFETSNLSQGGEATDYTDLASPALKKLAEDAAKRCFLDVTGVDIMTKDVSADSTDDSYIIELNLVPGLRMHQYPSQGKSVDVTSKVFDLIEKTAKPL